MNLQPWLRGALIAILIGVGIALAVAVRLNTETTSDRIRVSEHCQRLAQLATAAPDGKYIGELEVILTGDWKFARVQACIALGEAGPHATRALPSVIAAIDADDRALQQEAIRALGRIAGGSPISLQILERKLMTPDDFAMACFTAQTLGEIGTPARSTLPSLKLVAENSPSDVVRMAARLAIESIESAAGKF